MTSFSVAAQVKDSIASALEFQIEKASSDSIRIPLQIELANRTRFFDIESAKMMFETIFERVAREGSSSSFYLKQKADALNGLGQCAFRQGNSEESLRQQLASLKIREAIKDSIGLGYSYLNLGGIYRRDGNSSQSKLYYNKGLNIRKALKDSLGIAHILNGLGILYSEQKQIDSAFYFYRKAKQIDVSPKIVIMTNANMAALYFSDKNYTKAAEMYEESIQAYKILNDYKNVSTCFQNLGVVLTELKAYDRAIVFIDSAITYSKGMGDKELLLKQYYSRGNINERKGDFEQAYRDFKIYKAYSDTINDTEKVKRFTELELNYTFDKEKEAARIELEREESKKRRYFILFLLASITGMLLVYLIKKNNKQKLQLAKAEIALGEVEKLKASLTIANRETELTKSYLDSSFKEEVLDETLDDLKQIMSIEDESELRSAIKSLSASLLSEKNLKKSSSSLREYLNEISVNFKITLDTHFSELNPKEKELICLMKSGLDTAQISKILKSSASSIKSSRYRIRKKMGLYDKEDIIAYVDSMDIEKS